jgi:hypothetical protein
MRIDFRALATAFPPELLPELWQVLNAGRNEMRRQGRQVSTEIAALTGFVLKLYAGDVLDADAGLKGGNHEPASPPPWWSRGMQTGTAAGFLAVAESTVKRWAEDGGPLARSSAIYPIPGRRGRPPRLFDPDAVHRLAVERGRNPAHEHKAMRKTG